MRQLIGWWWHRRARTPWALRLLVASALGAYGLLGIVGTSSGQQTTPGSGASLTKQADNPGPGSLTTDFSQSTKLVDEGESLYDNGCSACHGLDLQGHAGVGPSLEGVGAGPIDFYLSTGRMPLQASDDEPEQARPVYDRQQTKALVAFLTTIGGGTDRAPTADPKAGSLAIGQQVFTESCAGCHQMVARGGLTVGAWVPNLQHVTTNQIAEAVRMGPYLMPHFDTQQIDQHQLNSLVRYVLYTRHPDNAGGWGIYNIGPIPEGIAAWFIALLALVLVARLIGERTEGANL